MTLPPCPVSLYSIHSICVQRPLSGLNLALLKCCILSLSTALLSLRGRVVVSSGSPYVLLPHQQIIILSISQKLGGSGLANSLKSDILLLSSLDILSKQSGRSLIFLDRTPGGHYVQIFGQKLDGNSWSNRVPNIGSWQNYHIRRNIFLKER